MYQTPQSSQLGDWKSFLKKTRDLVHRTMPRELSPTRLLEKYAVDTKKKSAAKLATVGAKSAAENAAADASLQKRLDALTSAVVPPGAAALDFASAPISQTSAPAPAAPAMPAAGNPLLSVGLGVGALALLWWMTRKSGRA